MTTVLFTLMLVQIGLTLANLYMAFSLARYLDEVTRHVVTITTRVVELLEKKDAQ